MIKIKFGFNNGFEAKFSGSRWKSKDRDVAKMLNGFLDLDEVSVSDAYRTSEYDSTVYGLDAKALDGVAFLEPEVVEYEPDEIPAEEEGVVI